MAIIRNDSSVDAHTGSLGADSFVLLAKALVAAAVGCGLYLQLGAGMGVSAGFALATYLALITLHMLRARSLRAEARNAGTTRSDTEAGRAKESTREPAAQSIQQKVATVEPPSLRPKTQATAPAAIGAVSPPPLSVPKANTSAASAPARSQAPPLPPQPGRRNEPTDDHLGHTALQEFWAYRPTETSPKLPMPAAAATPRRESLAAPAAAPRRSDPVWPSFEPVPVRDRQHAEPPQAALREADVEMIQSLIKKLADEVNAADAVQAVSTQQPPAGSGGSRSAPSDRGAGLAGLNKPAEAVEASLDALRVTAGTMRQAASRSATPPLAELRTSPAAQEPARAMPPVVPPPVRPGHFKLAAIADAVHSGRVDVLLEPIMGLGDLRARHYEVSIRLLDPAGGKLATGADDPALAGSNLLPLLDRTLLSRTASVAQRLDERGKTGAVFSEFSGEALTDERFVAGAADSCREREAFAGQLVLTFAQSAVRMLSEAQWRSLDELRSMGFRFALADVTELDMDFERLAETGFAFIKLDADVFLDGLKSPHGTVPSSDICGYLAQLGFTLIAGRIDSEYERSRLFGFGVLFGQGELFGGPRPLKADALAGVRHAA